MIAICFGITLPSAHTSVRMKLRDYAANGYAFDLEDNEPSIRCVAAPVRDASSGIVAAISVSSTVPYMSLERMNEMVDVVKDAAARISAELGWKVQGGPAKTRDAGT